MVEPALFGPIDAVLGPVIEHVLFVLVLVNLGTRFYAYRTHVQQAAAGGAEAISRFRPHEAVNVLLIVGSFYYMTVDHHSGMVLTVLVVGTVLADFFEFEARKVEARQDWDLEAPKGAIAGSLLVLAYAFYVSLFFLIAPIWNQIV